MLTSGLFKKSWFIYLAKRKSPNRSSTSQSYLAGHQADSGGEASLPSFLGFPEGTKVIVGGLPLVQGLFSKILSLLSPPGLFPPPLILQLINLTTKITTLNALSPENGEAPSPPFLNYLRHNSPYKDNKSSVMSKAQHSLQPLKKDPNVCNIFYLLQLKSV